MLVAPAFHLFVRRVVFRGRWLSTDESVESYVQILTALYGLLLGFVVVGLWQKQDEAERNTIAEANHIRIIFRALQSLPGDKQAMVDCLGDYTQNVIKKEWPMMLTGQQRELFIASPELDLLWDKIMALKHIAARDQAVYQEVISRYGQIVEARQRRLLDSERNLPVVLRIALIIGALSTWICIWFIRSEKLGAQMIMTALTSVYLFLLIYLVLVLEHPFLGAWRVESTPYQRVLDLLH